ncbi:MAG: hypothetical protein AVDCRST_MAG34-253 [uncultured Nocardioidaceae bacterium]|uniref:Uncharacterized protein n=1 Tax=uncultured Nocardioidaceae bacterium TaxID=253824 RepID=A0A6J4L6N7_9ACTN|nr:MAG: hypothetical protein AVDCRST_MAG34-253 [uncultured Nocardioidaceae bacterium]
MAGVPFAPSGPVRSHPTTPPVMKGIPRRCRMLLPRDAG